MTDKAYHIVWTVGAVAVFQRHYRTGDEHAIADLICDLGHLAEERGFDFLNEVRRGIGHLYAEHLPAQCRLARRRLLRCAINSGAIKAEADAPEAPLFRCY
jgi:hypothetical protein